MSDTSLVFNLVARDKASGELSAMGERFNTAAIGIGAGFAGALGVSIMDNMELEAAGSKLAAQLGVGPAEAAELAQVTANVFKDGWGDSVATVNEAIKGVYQNIGDVSAVEGGLEGVTTKALALADTFNQDLAMATAAAGQMIRTGLVDDANEAFDVLTVGLGSSADKAGDLLETFNEYSTQFRRVGLDAQTATGLIVQAMKAGARDSDQIADGIGIFGETALKGGKAVDEAFKSIGLNSKIMGRLMREGGDSSTKALQMTMDALRGTKNETVRLNAASALFGDPANIMGDALYALDPASAAAAAGMDKATGAADRMAKTVSDNPKAALESFKRSVMVELGQVGGAVGKFAMEHTGFTKGLGYALAGLAGIVLTVAAAQKVYAAYTAIATVATTIMNSASMAAVAGWARMLVWGLATYARIAAGAVASAAVTSASWVGSALVSIGTWIAAVVRAGATAVAQFALMAGRAVIWAITMAAQWLIAMGPVGWVIAIVVGLVALIIANWDKIVAFTKRIWPMVWGAIKSVGQMIWNFFLNWTLPGLIIKHWQSIKDGTVRKATEMVNWVRGLPGMIGRALGNLGGLLVEKGRDVVRGLWRGIQGMGPWLRDTLVGWAARMVPGPIARALGIASPSKVLADQVGRWIPAGVAMGAEDNRAVLDRTMSNLVQAPSVSATLNTSAAAAPTVAPLARAGMGGGGMVVVRLETTGADSAMRTLLQKIVRVEGRGNVQVAFGQ
ncbi:phage tail tape measure protein [Streptomyces sp. NPDC053541]|uniref:phage tail tape measure protein n=1 Tax=Streptomyces sp. NPDC053541 TaxID=3365709 RepID=UPI0037D54EDF